MVVQAFDLFTPGSWGIRNAKGYRPAWGWITKPGLKNPRRDQRDSSAGKGPCRQEEFGDLSLITGAHMLGGDVNSSKLSSDLLSCCGPLTPTYPPPHSKKKKKRRKKNAI